MQRFHIDPNIAKARTIASAFYTDPENFEASREKIFAISWQFIGSREQVKFAGDIHPFILLQDYLDEPLVLTRDNAENIHCLSNVCTHRGNLVAGKPCSKLSRLRCSYHGRIFELNGRLIT